MRRNKKLREFFVYEQEFEFKVSYMILVSRQYIPRDAKCVGQFRAKSKTDAATWLKNYLSASLTRTIGDGDRYVA